MSLVISLKPDTKTVPNVELEAAFYRSRDYSLTEILFTFSF